MALYTYRCKNCGIRETVVELIAVYADGDNRPECSCGTAGRMVRDYRTDKPQPAPMWPEHFNPSSGTVVRTRQQLQSDMSRNDDKLFERTGIEQRSVVVDYSDAKQAQQTSSE